MALFFEIWLNGEKLTTAGVSEDQYMLCAIVSGINDPDSGYNVALSVDAFQYSGKKNYRHSWPNRQLAIGDILDIKISENKIADEPASTREIRPTEKDLEYKRREYERLKQELTESGQI
ncbi:hypothetical protein GFS24_10510 [Chitinophaga sp. SYP-B3965]|uniref:hypothetical protein n=1 Tax=Chitinophaga sp. SYP-B3965 TaxID=2663120 RepID=UPI0012996C7B|nr:hypothetical protein [Chitinophaga sp. SYP-B3965]MRG45549.1 hypothetical protein [Chitinophaga sp. SYP-B3965]